MSYPLQKMAVSDDLPSRLESMLILYERMDRPDTPWRVACRAQETLDHHLSRITRDESMAIALGHQMLRRRLQELLEAWKLNQHILQQNLATAQEAGDSQEVERLNQRLAGIVLLWEQVEQALHSCSFPTITSSRTKS